MSHVATFSAPENYRIEVQGVLRPDWSDRFGAMRILSQSPDHSSDQVSDQAPLQAPVQALAQARQVHPSITVLQGSVSDQAELAGILNTLYELHLPLRLVQHLR